MELLSELDNGETVKRSTINIDSDIKKKDEANPEN